MRRTPLQRRSPLSNKPKAAREHPEPIPVDLTAARKALAHREAAMSLRDRVYSPVPQPVRGPRQGDGSFPPVVRQTILDRDHLTCARCGVAIDTSSVGYSLQHRVARGMGGTSDPRIAMPANGIVLCGSATTGCHGWVESHRTEAERCGWAVVNGFDPETVPVLTMADGWVRLDNKGNRWRCAAAADDDAHTDAQHLGPWK